MRSSIILSCVLSLTLLTGCVTPVAQQGTTEVAPINNTCRFIERNLTEVWDNRSYWCIPQE